MFIHFLRTCSQKPPDDDNASSWVELLMDLPNLLINVHPLPSFHLLALFQLPVIIQRRLLPPRSLFFTDDRLSCDAVKDIASLRR